MRPVPLLLVIALAAACFPSLGDALAYQRARVADGEAWRLLTAHLAHDDVSHFVLDATAVTILALACERLARGLANRAVILALAVISFTLLPLAGDVDEYRGLSAIASALFVAAATMLARSGRDSGDELKSRIASILILAFAAKTTFEWSAGVALFCPDTVYPPWPMAHAAGGVVGFFAAITSNSAASRMPSLAPIPETSS